MLANDLWYAIRALGKRPAFALAAIVTMALGVAASTAIFSVTKAVLLNPLPYAGQGCGSRPRASAWGFWARWR